MDYQTLLSTARNNLSNINGHQFDVLDIKKPTSLEHAKNLAKIISKLSPILGNLIEFSTVDILNEYDWENLGTWIRQDPGFPDALFLSNQITPNPGIEIKAWFPLATEITARFKDSVTMFANNNIDLALIAWLPEKIIWGKPQVLDVLVVSGKSVAESRDLHYHKPPKYLVFEPEDTSARTSNLQQTNTNGYRIQEDKCDIRLAQEIVNSWGENGCVYSPNSEYQQKIKNLQSQFPYRLDTNYAKIDRIEHPEIEAFKTTTLNKVVYGKTISEWAKVLASENDSELEQALHAILA